MKTNTIITKRALSLVSFLILCVFNASAASEFNGSQVLNNMATNLADTIKPFINILFYLGLIAMAAGLIPAAIKYFRNEPQSNDSLTKIGIGGAIMFIILGVIKLML